MQQVEIRIKGQIDRDWSDWMGGLVINHSHPGETVLTGSVRDQAALYGLLNRLADLGLHLNSVMSDGVDDEAITKKEGSRNDNRTKETSRRLGGR